MAAGGLSNPSPVVYTPEDKPEQDLDPLVVEIFGIQSNLNHPMFAKYILVNNSVCIKFYMPKFRSNP